MVDLPTRILEIGRQRIRVGVRAGTRPPLLLCNGIGANLELLVPVMDALQPIETIAFDVPGTGESPPSPEPMRLPGLAQVVAKMVARLGYEEIDVLGLSWGGFLAQQLAAQYPRQVRRLVLVSTAPTMTTTPSNPATAFQMNNPRRWNDPEYLQRIAPKIYGGELRTNPSKVREAFHHTKKPSYFGYYGQLVAALGWSSLGWLHRLPQPTLVISGTDDPLIPVSMAYQLAERIPHARLRLFDDGHLLLLTRVNEVATLIGGFLTEPAAPTVGSRQR